MSRSTFRVLFYLKRNAPKKNGMIPVMCRITVNGKVSQFSSKLDVEEKMWNVETGRLSGRSLTAQEGNRMLDKIRVGINKAYQVVSERMLKEGLEFTDNRFVVEGNYKYTYNNGHLAMADPLAAARNFLNALERIPSIIDQYKSKNEVLEREIPQLQEIAGKVWKKEDELKQLKSELAALDRKIQLELAPPTPEVAQKEKELKPAQHEGQLPHSPDPTAGIKTMPDTPDIPMVPVQRESEYNKHSFSKFRL